MSMLVNKDNLEFGYWFWKDATSIDYKIIKKILVQVDFRDYTTQDSYGIPFLENILKNLAKL